MLGNGTIKTIENEEDIYISLTQLCGYFVKSVVNMNKEIEEVDSKDKRYAQGLIDMMGTIASEMVELGKFEAQRRMIDTPQDILDLFDKNNFKDIE
jgi:threonine aldolase